MGVVAYLKKGYVAIGIYVLLKGVIMVAGVLSRMVVRRSLLLLAVYTSLLAFAYAGFSNLLPAILESRGVPVMLIGVVYSIEKAIVFVASMIILAFSANPRIYYLMPLLLIFYGLLIFTFTIAENMLLASFLVPLISGVYMSLRPLNRALVNLLISRKIMGFASGMLDSISMLAATASTLAYGFLLESLGLQKSALVLLAFLVPALITQLHLIMGLRAVSSLDATKKSWTVKRELVDLPLIILSLAQLVEAAIAVYISIILRNILGRFALAGLALSTPYILGLVSRPFLGYVSDRVSMPITLMGFSLCLLSLSYMLLSLSYSHPYLVFLSLAIMGIAPSIFLPNLQIYVKNLRVPPTYYFSMLELLSSICGIISPAVAAIAISAMGFETFLKIYAMAELLLGLALLIAPWRRSSRRVVARV